MMQEFHVSDDWKRTYLGAAVGVLGLSGVSSFQVVENVGGKIGLSRPDQYEMISSPDGIISSPKRASPTLLWELRHEAHDRHTGL